MMNTSDDLTLLKYNLYYKNNWLRVTSSKRINTATQTKEDDFTLAMI